jgi:hypothetical protein
MWNSGDEPARVRGTHLSPAVSASLKVKRHQQTIAITLIKKQKFIIPHADRMEEI